MPIRTGKNAWAGTWVDDDVYREVNRHAWRSFGTGYVGRKVYRDRIDGKSRYSQVYLHRLITDCPDGLVVDHINGNKRDNRRENLRVGTQSLNNRNRDGRAGSSSQYKGVRRTHPSVGMASRPWVAQINVGGRNRHLGYFATEKDAARAYDRAVLEQAGQFAHFARLNFSEEGPA